jgi:hypothetical protein
VQDALSISSYPKNICVIHFIAMSVNKAGRAIMSHSYLDVVRDINKIKMSKCEKCGAKSETIDADKERIFPICKRCFELAHPIPAHN